MDTRYPPEIQALLKAIDKARKQLRREMKRGQQLLRQIENRVAVGTY